MSPDPDRQYPYHPLPRYEGPARVTRRGLLLFPPITEHGRGRCLPRLSPLPHRPRSPGDPLPRSAVARLLRLPRPLPAQAGAPGANPRRGGASRRHHPARTAPVCAGFRSSSRSPHLIWPRQISAAMSHSPRTRGRGTALGTSVRSCRPLTRLVAVLVAVCAAAGSARGKVPEPPPHLPYYDIALALDTHNRRAQLSERVTWTNTTNRPTSQLVFNFYPHYCVPQGDYVLFAKTLELLRLQPSYEIDRNGRFGVVKEARLIAQGNRPLDRPQHLAYEFDHDNMTALRFHLPQPVNPGESVTVELNCSYNLPNKQGRLGQ